MQGESIVTAAGGKAVLVWSLATTGLKKLQHEIERQLVIPNFFPVRSQPIRFLFLMRL